MDTHVKLGTFAQTVLDCGLFLLERIDLLFLAGIVGDSCLIESVLYVLVTMFL